MTKKIVVVFVGLLCVLFLVISWFLWRVGAEKYVEIETVSLAPKK